MSEIQETVETTEPTETPNEEETTETPGTTETPAEEETPEVTNSILVSVRSMCNVNEDDNGFDQQLIPLINSQLMIAHHQLGVGVNGFNITGVNETWTELLGAAESKLSAVKMWLGYSVLLLFDPPDNGTVLKAIQETLAKTEWMLASKSRLEGYARTVYPVEYVEED